MFKKKDKTEGVAEEEGDKEPKDGGLWRDLVAYWILGLGNNYGYVVMLSAAHDIIGQFDNSNKKREGMGEGRDCHFLSTGVILLADVIPEFLMKLVLPFCPFWIHVRMAAAIGAAVSGFLLVAFATTTWVAIMGVIMTSAACGIGGSTLLSYTAGFNKNVVSTWSSGTGGAGVLGSFLYAALIGGGLSPKVTILIMLIVPTLEACAFWLLLRPPKDKSVFEKTEPNSDEQPFSTLKEKCQYVLKNLLKYMIPLVLVYFFEYFINQGLFELVYFKNIFLDHAAQYRWLSFDYQLGVLISRSSVNIVQIPWLWIMAILQGVNVIYFLTEVIFFYTPTIWIVFIIVFWEGLLGGGAYVNTFYKISKEVEPSRKAFSMGAVATSDSFGIIPAGFFAMPVHNAICTLDVK